jgi:hypothetical protein
MLLWSVLLKEFGERCCTSTSHDLKKVMVRFEHEGVSFLTITLPAFCKELEKALEDGKVSPDQFTGFRKSGSLPLFLGGFLDRVFDRGTGRLLENPDVDSIFAVRQLTLFYSKILLDCSPSRQRGAIVKFLECEKDLKSADRSTTPEMVLDLSRVSALLFRDVFSLMDSDVYNENIMGRHGPGATADRLRGNEKYDLTEWPERLEREFSFGYHASPSPRYNQEDYSRVSILEPGAERPVKVTLVPKTLKTPRVIAIEPTAVQYMQQGIMEKLVDYLERDETLSGMIGFSEQGPNQTLAREGSRKGLLATLDLSEASDRVSNQHVRVMLQRFPSFSRAVDATRSRKADVPGHGVIRLAKFASMGSALCFPFEAMVFLSLIFIGIERELNRPLTRKDLKVLSSQVRVYGDDLIVPVRFVPSVIATLESYGYRVNAHKSFWNGKFRESCGKDYYDGLDVSVVKCRRVLPTSRNDVQETISLVSLRNQLYFAGLWRTAGYLDRILASVLRHYPVLDPDLTATSFTGKVEPSKSSLLGRQSIMSFDRDIIWADSDLQIPLVRGYVVSAKAPKSEISGTGALLKGFLKRGEQPFADRDHLERQGRPQAVNIKLRWKAPF